MSIFDQIAQGTQRNFLADYATGLQARSSLDQIRSRQQFNALVPQLAQGDQGAFNQAIALDPQRAYQTVQARQAMTAQQVQAQQRAVEQAARLLTFVEQQPEELRPAAYQQARQMYLQTVPDVDPSTVPEQYDPSYVGMTLAQVVPMAERIKAMTGTGGPANVQEWRYFSSLSPQEQEQYLTMKRASPTFRMGDVTMRGEQIGTGAVPLGADAGATQEVVQERISKQEAEKTAMQENVKAASKRSDEAFARLEKVRANIANYDEAIRLIDQGAETGVVAARLPSFRQASIALDNLQGRLGLDVIGNTTFGALSEAELKFALNTALPKNLEGPALKDWIMRKKAAQEKLAAYLEQAAIFLGTPGNTVKGWIEVQKQAGGGASPEVVAPTPAPAPQAAPIKFLGFE